MKRIVSLWETKFIKELNMKKYILSFLIYIIGVTPVFSQTYQELADRAIACTEQDSLTQACLLYTSPSPRDTR